MPDAHLLEHIKSDAKSSTRLTKTPLQVSFVTNVANSNHRDHWFRRTTWTAKDQEEFFARLNRSRDSGKPQYLRIQALHLSNAGLSRESLELSDYLLSKFPTDAELAMVFLTRAESYEALGELDLAVESFRASLAAQRARPTMRTNAWLDFGRFVVSHRMKNLYPEVCSVLDEFSEPEGLVFPAGRFIYLAVRAHMYENSDQMDEAISCAKGALEAAMATHSGFAFHAEVGLVRDPSQKLMQQLKRLASGKPSQNVMSNLVDRWKLGKRKF